MATQVGSLEGASAIWTAENILKHPDSLLVCLDLWGETAGTLYDKNMTTVEVWSTSLMTCVA